MAIKLITGNPVYYGTAAEIQAITTATPGSLGFATNTSVWYTTIDGSTWVAYSTVGSGDALQSTSLAVKAKTDLIPADNVTQLDTNLPAVMNSIILTTGTLTTSSVTAPADTARAEATHYWDGCLLLITGGTYKGQVRRITTFTTATGVFTLAAAYATAPGQVTYAILASQ